MAAYVLRNRVHAGAIIRNRAWCICPRHSICVCHPPGENPGNVAYDAVRYALSRLMAISQHYTGSGYEAYIARLCMVAYLPVTRLFDTAATKNRSPDTYSVANCAPLVNIDKVLCFDTMPNMCGLMFDNDYWYETKNFVEGSLESAYHHMFCKALPQRCKLRSTLPICVLYGVQHGQFADFMYAVVRCSLMGLLPTATAACSFETIRRIDQLFTPPDTSDSGTRCEFVCRFGYIMFHTVKNFVTYAVSGISGLREVLDLTYGWWAFEKQVASTMTQIRLQISDELSSVTPTATLFEPIATAPEVVPLLGIDPLAAATNSETHDSLLMEGFIGTSYSSRPLKRWSRASKSMIVTTGGGQLVSKGDTTAGVNHRSFEAAIGPAEDLAFRLNGLGEKNMFQMCREPAHVIIRLCLQTRAVKTPPLDERLPRYEPLQLHTAEARMQQFYGVSPATAKAVIDGLMQYRATGYVSGQLVTHLSSDTLSDDDARALSIYCSDIDISALFHFVPLPDDIRLAQLEALRRKYQIHASNTCETELINLSEVYFCLTCMSTKAFVVESAALGHVGCGSVGIPHVVFNNDTRQLECRQCVDKTHMFRFTMAGILARIGKTLHCICTECASICVFDAFAYRGDEYVCATCCQRRISRRQSEFYRVEQCALGFCDKKLPKDGMGSDLLVIDDTTQPSHVETQRVVAYCSRHRRLANQVHKTTQRLSEMNATIETLMFNGNMPARGAVKKKEITRTANAARRHEPYSLFGGAH